MRPTNPDCHSTSPALKEPVGVRPGGSDTSQPPMSQLCSQFHFLLTQPERHGYGLSHWGLATHARPGLSSWLIPRLLQASAVTPGVAELCLRKSKTQHTTALRTPAGVTSAPSSAKAASERTARHWPRLAQETRALTASLLSHLLRLLPSPQDREQRAGSSPLAPLPRLSGTCV